MMKKLTFPGKNKMMTATSPRKLADDPKDRRLRQDALMRCAMTLAFLFALSFVLGDRLARNGRTGRTVSEWMETIGFLLVMTVVSYIAVRFIFAFFNRIWDGRVKSRILGKEYSDRQVFLFYSACIFICWIPVFLAYYPSVFAYDAEGQLYQFLAHDYSTHHPLIHTLFLSAFFQIGGSLFASYSAGMAIHSLVQMLLMALVFGYTLMVLYRGHTSWVMRLIMLVFYAIFPANSILAISTTKDVLFSGLVLLYMVKLYQWISGGPKTKGLGASFILLSAMMLLFRNNAVYAFLASQPFIILLCGKKKRRQYLVVAMCSFLLFLAGSAGLKAVTSAKNGSPREMLSIPLQQMARTRVLHEEEIDAAMREELDGYLPKEWVFAAYNPYLADPVKNRAVIHDNPVGLIKTWVKLGLCFPLTYMDAFLSNSVGYWYLADTTHAQIYGIGTESGFGYLSTDNRTMPAGCEIVEHSYLPGLRAFMERIVSDNVYQKVPIVSVIFAPAFYWWLLCLYVAFFWYRRDQGMILPAVFLLLYYCTLLLSPTVLIRYMYPFVVSVPALICLISKRKST